MNALTLPDLLQPLEQDCSDSFLLPAARPKFTRRPRTSDLRVAFKADSFDTATVTVEQVRLTPNSLNHTPYGSHAVAEVIASCGAMRCRCYLTASGEVLVPRIFVGPVVEERIRSAVTSALADLVRGRSAAR